MHAFFPSPFFAGIRPLAGAIETLRAHADHCRYVVVTSRQHSIAKQTLEWLSTHYPGIFADVLFGNHWGPSGTTKRTKLDMCRAAGATLLIDDSPAYAAEVASAGITALLFGDYPWNRGDRHEPLVLPPGGGSGAAALLPAAGATEGLPPLVHRVSSWAQVSELLGRLRRAE